MKILTHDERQKVVTDVVNRITAGDEMPFIKIVQMAEDAILVKLGQQVPLAWLSPNDPVLNVIKGLHDGALTDEGTTAQCTCPSGDGSLRWPCPVHPPVARYQIEVQPTKTLDGELNVAAIAVPDINGEYCRYDDVIRIAKGEANA